MDGLWVFVAWVLALSISVISFEAGRSSVADQCEHFGKTHIKQTTYVCTKP